MRRQSERAAFVAITALSALGALLPSGMHGQTVTPKERVRLRSAPSLEQPIERVLNPGERLRVLTPDTAATGFVQVHALARGDEGWVASDFVKPVGATALSAVLHLDH